MDWTWNASATRRLASTSTLTSSTPPLVSATTFSRIGPSVRHGPHHSAHRSTTTGTSAERSRTAVSKVASVTSIALYSLSHLYSPRCNDNLGGDVPAGGKGAGG